MKLELLRREIADYARRILKENLATGAGGNISARWEDTMLISPSGLSLEEVDPAQYVEVDVPSGDIRAQNGLRPSSEVLMHLACYRKRPEVRAVVHTHPQYTIALTSSGHDLAPMFADALIYMGSSVPHLDYITVTTPELAVAVGEAIKEANCLVLRNHGAVTVGENLKQAFWRACTVEEAARIQVLSLMIGKPRFLDKSESDRLDSLASEQYRRELIARMRDV
ncbi:MAG: class II aldolase/adducin family protein [Acidobacteriota bacterium]